MFLLSPSVWSVIVSQDAGSTSSNQHSHATSHNYNHNHNSLPPFVDVLPPGPSYDVERSGNVTALVNQPAKLNCRVNKIGNRTVRTRGCRVEERGGGSGEMKDRIMMWRQGGK